MLFLDCHTRDLYVDWQRKARAVVGNLRLVAGRHPDDQALAALIGELSMKSADFVALWRDHRVKPCEADAYQLRHPTVGPLTVTQHNLVVARASGQSVCIVTAAPGSPRRTPWPAHRNDSGVCSRLFQQFVETTSTNCCSVTRITPWRS